MAEKYLDYSGTDLLWRKILKLLNKKIEKVESSDESIKVTGNNKVAVNISASETNNLSLVNDGLYVPNKMHTLTFGAHQEFVYDGSENVIVPEYDGTHYIN